MKLQPDMEKVFYNWCDLLNIEQDYRYIKEFLKDCLTYYHIQIHENSEISIKKIMGHDALYQKKDGDLITQFTFSKDNVISFAEEINNSLELKNKQT